jgi:hypothetical protein
LARSVLRIPSAPPTNGITPIITAAVRSLNDLIESQRAMRVHKSTSA